MNKSLWGLLAGLGVLFLLHFAGDALLNAENPSDFVRFLGRFHPSLVHLPIGILLAVVAIEVGARWPRFSGARGAVPLLLLVGAWSALAAGIVGLLLAGPDHDADALWWHKRLGLAVAVFAVVAYALAQRRSGPEANLGRAYPAALVLTALALLFGGHLGGELTHGEGYLTRYMADPLRAVIGLPSKATLTAPPMESLEEAVVYTHLVQPILTDKCVTCHSSDQSKGGLVLESAEGLQTGGDDGDALVPGRPDESLLIQRIWLPLDHDDHMPPRGKPQVSVAEAELIKWWIAQGASYEQTLAEAEPTPVVQAIFDAMGLDEIKTGIFALDVPPADADDLAAFQQTGAAVTPLAEDVPFLSVQCINVTQTFDDDALAALTPLGPQVAWLNLARTQVTDDGLDVLARMPHLTRLHLENTAVTDDGLQHLAGLEHLAYLNLYGTAVTDAGLQHLAQLPRLKNLYLWQTQVTPEAAAQLEASVEGLTVNLGITNPPVEVANTGE